MLKIKNQALVTENAELSAVVPDPYWVDKYSPESSKEMYWMLKIVCRSETSDAQANLSHENIRIASKSWKKLKGTKVIWDAPIDDDEESPASIMRDYEEEELATGTITFGARRKDKYSIEWKCKSKPKFTLATQVQFTGVIVRASQKESAKAVRERISQFLLLEEYEVGKLKLQPHAYQSGTKMANMFLTPRV